MTPSKRQWLPEAVIALARSQHWVVSLSNLKACGLSRDEIRWAADAGPLHRIYDGVFAVGRPDLTREGRWMAAVLAVGEDAVVSRIPAGLLWEIVKRGDERPHVTILGTTHRTGSPRAPDARPRCRQAAAHPGHVADADDHRSGRRPHPAGAEGRDPRG